MLSPIPKSEWPSQETSPALQLQAREHELDFLPPESLSRSLWRSLLANLRDTFAPEQLPPPQLTSRPLDVGMLLGDRLALPWYRTVFTNLGDVVSPETLPPLELESHPVDVGELIADQLSHLWLTSLLRNLADAVAPERWPALPLTSTPDESILPSKIMLLPRWSSLIEGPKVFPPDAPKLASSAAPPSRAAALPGPALPRPVVAQLEFLHVLENDLQRDVRRSRLRVRLWMSLAAAQVLFLLASLFRSG